MANIPSEIWLFRIIHYQNLVHILKNGLFTAHHHLADANYISIGDNTLIQVRGNYAVPITPPNSDLGNYIPFYFGYRSPMLYKIYRGNQGVKQYPQEEIIYLCCKLTEVVNTGVEWCFTDGHAKTSTTQFFNDLKDLDKVDWQTVYSKEWKNTEKDTDRMRKKQAEFLVKNYLSANIIHSIVCFNEKMLNNLDSVFKSLSLSIPIKVNKKDTKNDFYY